MTRERYIQREQERREELEKFERAKKDLKAALAKELDPLLSWLNKKIVAMDDTIDRIKTIVRDRFTKLKPEETCGFRPEDYQLPDDDSNEILTGELKGTPESGVSESK